MLIENSIVYLGGKVIKKAMTKITVQRKECFKTNGHLFVPAYAMSTVFNSKGLTKNFDKGNCIIHPTKGRLYPLVKELKQYIKIVEE